MILQQCFMWCYNKHVIINICFLNCFMLVNLFQSLCFFVLNIKKTNRQEPHTTTKNYLSVLCHLWQYHSVSHISHESTPIYSVSVFSFRRQQSYTSPSLFPPTPGSHIQNSPTFSSLAVTWSLGGRGCNCLYKGKDRSPPACEVCHCRLAGVRGTNCPRLPPSQWMNWKTIHTFHVCMSTTVCWFCNANLHKYTMVWMNSYWTHMFNMCPYTICCPKKQSRHRLSLAWVYCLHMCQTS